MENKNVVLLIVLTVATLLTAVVGTTFAYFTTTVNKNITGGANDASIKTAQYTATTITFAMTGDKLVMNDAIPGQSKTTSFTVKNEGNTDIEYNVIWKDVTNDFNENGDPSAAAGTPASATAANNLVYSMSCTGGTTYTKAETVMPLNDSDTNAQIASKIKVTQGQTATCTLTATFKETGAEQNENQGRTFTGTIDVTTEPIKAN